MTKFVLYNYKNDYVYLADNVFSCFDRFFKASYKILTEITLYRPLAKGALYYVYIVYTT